MYNCSAICLELLKHYSLPSVSWHELNHKGDISLRFLVAVKWMKCHFHKLKKLDGNIHRYTYVKYFRSSVYSHFIYCSGFEEVWKSFE